MTAPCRLETDNIRAVVENLYCTVHKSDQAKICDIGLAALRRQLEDMGKALSILAQTQEDVRKEAYEELEEGLLLQLKWAWKERADQARVMGRLRGALQDINDGFSFRDDDVEHAIHRIARNALSPTEPKEPPHATT